MPVVKKQQKFVFPKSTHSWTFRSIDISGEYTFKCTHCLIEAVGWIDYDSNGYIYYCMEWGDFNMDCATHAAKMREALLTHSFEEEYPTLNSKENIYKVCKHCKILATDDIGEIPMEERYKFKNSPLFDLRPNFIFPDANSDEQIHFSNCSEIEILKILK